MWRPSLTSNRDPADNRGLLSFYFSRWRRLQDSTLGGALRGTRLPHTMSPVRADLESIFSKLPRAFVCGAFRSFFLVLKVPTARVMRYKPMLGIRELT